MIEKSPQDNVLLYSIANELPLPLILIDKSLNAVWANKESRSILKVKKINKPFCKSLNCFYSFKKKNYGTSGPCLKCSIKKAINETLQTKNNCHNIEGKITIKDQKKAKKINISVSTKLIISDPHHLVLTVIEDITRSKEMECFFNEINKSLMDLDKIKSSFVANVSHEFKSPLAIIFSSSELLLSRFLGKLNKKQSKLLDDIKNTSLRLGRLVKDMLDISAIEAGKMKLKKANTPIRPYIKKITNIFRKQLKDKKLKLSTSLDKKIKLLKFDQDKIEQVLINLIDNAIKYSKPKTKLKLHLIKHKNNAIFEIITSSRIISSNDLPKIFDKFERIKETRKEGTGLGLSIAKDIVQLHHGKIWVESKKGTGTKFSFSLPC